MDSRHDANSLEDDRKRPTNVNILSVAFLRTIDEMRAAVQVRVDMLIALTVNHFGLPELIGVTVRTWIVVRIEAREWVASDATIGFDERVRWIVGIRRLVNQ